MFEKEAEEYAMTEVNGTFAEMDVYEKCFKDGAEFGYQKGLEVKINMTTLSDYPMKDEWHYPSKGEYPKDEKQVLVYMWGSFYIGSYKQYTDDNNTWHFNDFDEESEQITAWKYIVPPKEVSNDIKGTKESC